VRETIRAWFDILRDVTTEVLNDIRVAWSRTRHVIYPGYCNIKDVCGIMSNVIYILTCAGWTPRLYNCWEDSDGSIRAITDFQVAPDIVAAAIARSFFNLDLQRAAAHYNGGGVDQGVDVDSTLKFLRNTRTNTNPDYRFVACLETIIAAGAWPAARIHEVHPDFSSECPRCHAAPETALHTFWQCPCNNDIDHIAVKHTQVLCKEAAKGVELFPCFWLRGIMPAEFTEIPDEYCPSTHEHIVYINEQDGPWESGTYYGDASGGKYTMYSTLRRVGVGVAAANSEGELSFGLHSNLPGKVQTVSKGELYALYLVVRHVCDGAVIDFVTDNFGVFSVYNSGEKSAANSANCNLYFDIFRIVSRKSLKLSVRWMPSHLSPSDDRPSNVSQLDVHGNSHADELARKAAAADGYQLPNAVAVPIMIVVKRLVNIQRRLSTILLYLPERLSYKKTKRNPEPKFDINLLLSNTSHKIIVADARYSCTVCLNSFHIKDPARTGFNQYA